MELCKVPEINTYVGLGYARAEQSRAITKVPVVGIPVTEQRVLSPEEESYLQLARSKYHDEQPSSFKGNRK